MQPAGFRSRPSLNANVDETEWQQDTSVLFSYVSLKYLVGYGEIEEDELDKSLAWSSMALVMFLWIVAFDFLFLLYVQLGKFPSKHNQMQTFFECHKANS